MDPAVEDIQGKFGAHPCSDFWFPDGNIVLISGQAAFKVHRGHLARHSEVFKDLFSVPQPQDQDLIDGCSLVELHDCPSDVVHFLGALYDGLYFDTSRAANLFALAAVLRLSTKYVVDHLRNRCLRRLELDWPLTLAGWDLREQDATKSDGQYLPREICAHPILFINVAFELGLYSMLPAAFYDLSRYGPSKIMLGAVSPHPPPHPATSDPALSSGDDTSVQLSADLFHRILLGRESSQRFTARFIEFELKERAPATDCAYNTDDDSSQPCPCRQSFYFITLNLLRAVGGIAHGRDADVLFTLSQATDMLSRTDFWVGEKPCGGLDMCAACKIDFSESVRKAREEVWALIPTWFGMETRDCSGKGGPTVSGCYYL